MKFLKNLFTFRRKETPFFYGWEQRGFEKRVEDIRTAATAYPATDWSKRAS